MLVFATDLEQVKEIGCGSMDRNEVLVRLRNWIGEGRDLKFFWAL